MKFKRVFALLTAFSMMFGMMTVTSCSRNKDADTEASVSEEFDGRDSRNRNLIDMQEEKIRTEEDDPEGDISILYVPDLARIQAICQLATVESYYNCVASGIKTPGTGFVHIGEEERVFWIEYTATAYIGIDINDVEMEIVGNTIYISIPEAGLIGDISTDYSSFEITSNPDGFNENPIEMQDYEAALNESIDELRVRISNDTALMDTASERARTTIENYIYGISEASGVEYTIVWVEEGDINS